MELKHHLHPDKLETYSFWWSEARLVLAALTLLLNGMPFIFFVLPRGFIILTWPLLELSWLISGVASAYMIYRWYAGGQKLFGHKKIEDLVAFAISVISGINLGLAGVTHMNIGMQIAGGRLMFLIVAVVYLIVAGYLLKRWNESSTKIF